MTSSTIYCVPFWERFNLNFWYSLCALTVMLYFWKKPSFKKLKYVKTCKIRTARFIISLWWMWITSIFFGCQICGISPPRPFHPPSAAVAGNQTRCGRDHGAPESLPGDPSNSQCGNMVARDSLGSCSSRYLNYKNVAALIFISVFTLQTSFPNTPIQMWWCCRKKMASRQGNDFKLFGSICRNYFSCRTGPNKNTT